MELERLSSLKMVGPELILIINFGNSEFFDISLLVTTTKEMDQLYC